MRFRRKARVIERRDGVDRREPDRLRHRLLVTAIVGCFAALWIGMIFAVVTARDASADVKQTRILVSSNDQAVRKATAILLCIQDDAFTTRLVGLDAAVARVGIEGLSPADQNLRDVLVAGIQRFKIAKAELGVECVGDNFVRIPPPQRKQRGTGTTGG